MNLLVFDIGTSSMRGSLMDDCAEVLTESRCTYHPCFHSREYVTQDPLIWKKALVEIATDITKWCKINSKKIHGISLTSQRSSLIPVNKNGEHLCDAIMWQDKRNIKLCQMLKQENKEIIRRSGSSINPIFSGSKMAWLQRERKDIYENAYKLPVVADYLLFQITGQWKTDRTYGSRSHLMNLRTGQWDCRLLDIFQVEEEKLCQLMEPGELHGIVGKEFALLTGMTEGIPVYSAGGDQQCAALGMGIVEEGTLEVTSGTGAFIIGLTKKLPDVFFGNIITNYSAIKGFYIVESSILTCCAAFDWFCSNFYQTEGEMDYAKINREIAMSPPGANGCLFLPFFQGRATPAWNPEATAAFINVTLSTTRGDMARAVLEGIAYEIRNSIDVVEGIVGLASQISIGGGLSKNPEFNKIQADVYGRKLSCYSNRESTTLGAWISTSVQMGNFASVKEAFHQSRQRDTIIYYEPDTRRMEMYRTYRKEMNQIYRRIYEKSKMIRREKGLF